MSKTVQDPKVTSQPMPVSSPQGQLNQDPLLAHALPQDHLLEQSAMMSSPNAKPEQAEKLRARLEEALGVLAADVERLSLLEHQLEDAQGDEEKAGKIRQAIGILEGLLQLDRARVLELAQSVPEEQIDGALEPLVREALLVEFFTNVRRLDLKSYRGKTSETMGDVAKVGLSLMALIKQMEVEDFVVISEQLDESDLMGHGRKHELTVGRLSERQNQRVEYVRFVKATKLLGDVVSCTIPGYVCYSQPQRVEGDTDARVAAARQAHAAQAAWSYDGPGAGISVRGKDMLTIIDEPGELGSRGEHFPYVLIMEFVGVVFDPMTLKVLRKVEYKDEIVRLEDPHRERRLERVRSLKSGDNNPKKDGDDGKKPALSRTKSKFGSNEAP